MDATKSKSLRNLEEKMESVSEDSVRYHILDSAKRFKTSWIDLGRALYAAWKDKLYKGWGYSTFDVYTLKEIGIRKQTAVKLLKSYYFLEKEEPQYLTQESESEAPQPAVIPSYESVDVLRRAKAAKGLDPKDYSKLRAQVFEKGRDAVEVKKDLTTIMRQREELDPEDAWQQKRMSVIRRLIGALKSVRQEAEVSKILPAPLVQEVAGLIKKLEMESLKE